MKRDKRSPVAACSCWRALAACFAGFPASAADLDAGGLTFRDFAANDNGASFNRGVDPDDRRRPQPGVVAGRRRRQRPGASRGSSSARSRSSWRCRWAGRRPRTGSGASAYSGDKRYRLIIWRVDFAFEGVKDAEHYAATKTGSIQARRPSIQAQARKLGDGTFLIVYENAPKGQGDSEQRTVFDLLMQNPGNPKEGILMTLGVPASDAARGLKLLALLKQNMRINW